MNQAHRDQAPKPRDDAARSEERAAPLALLGVVLLFIVIAVAAASHWLLSFFGPPVPQAPLAHPPAVSLEPHPAATLAQFRREKLRARDSYGWIDRASGVAHIPVSRAMKLLVERAKGSGS